MRARVMRSAAMPPELMTGSVGPIGDDGQVRPVGGGTASSAAKNAKRSSGLFDDERRIIKRHRERRQERRRPGQDAEPEADAAPENTVGGGQLPR
jgi:hypothetical protein